MKLGEILIHQKSITQDQLALALWVQKRWGGLLGRILVSRGALPEADLIVALSGQLGIPSVDLRSRCMPTCVCHLLPQELCISHLLLPFGRDPDSGVLQVAMADPRDPAGLAALRGCFSGPCRVYLCGYVDLTDALFRQAHQKPDAAPSPVVRRATQEIIEADSLVEEVAIPMPVAARRTVPPLVEDELEVLEESDMLAAMTAQALAGRPAEVDLIVESGDFEIISAEEDGPRKSTEPIGAAPVAAGTVATGTDPKPAADAPAKPVAVETEPTTGAKPDEPAATHDDAAAKDQAPTKESGTKAVPKPEPTAKDSEKKGPAPPARRGLLAALAGGPREPEKKVPDKKPPPSPFDARDRK